MSYRPRTLQVLKETTHLDLPGDASGVLLKISDGIFPAGDERIFVMTQPAPEDLHKNPAIFGGSSANVAVHPTGWQKWPKDVEQTLRLHHYFPGFPGEFDTFTELTFRRVGERRVPGRMFEIMTADGIHTISNRQRSAAFRARVMQRNWRNLAKYGVAWEYTGTKAEFEAAFPESGVVKLLPEYRLALEGEAKRLSERLAQINIELRHP